MAESDIPEEIQEKYDEVLNQDDEVKDETDDVSGKQDETSGVDDSTKGEYEDIPDDLVAIGRKHNLSDEQIVKLSEETPEVLEALAAAELKLAALPQDEKKEDTQKTKTAEDGLDISLDGLDDKSKAIFEKVVSELKEVKGKIAKTEVERQQESDRLIDKVFDSVENVPDIGKTKTLTDEQFAIRKGVWGIAASFQHMGGGTTEECLKKAVEAYANQDGKNAEESLRRKVNKSKKRFTARPGGQKSKGPKKSQEERALDVIDEKFDEFGLG